MAVMLRSNPKMRLSLVIFVVLLAIAAPAGARTPDPRSSADLWATINVCDTFAHPDTIGIRGSMPGIGRRATLWMRFQVQFFQASDQKWHNLDQSADSSWKRIGIARSRVLESGQN